jgi:hypothetical protein
MTHQDDRPCKESAVPRVLTQQQSGAPVARALSLPSKTLYAGMAAYQADPMSAAERERRKTQPCGMGRHACGISKRTRRSNKKRGASSPTLGRHRAVHACTPRPLRDHDAVPDSRGLVQRV